MDDDDGDMGARGTDDLADGQRHVRRLSAENDLQSARAALHAVFEVPDPFTGAFRSSVEGREIIFPVDLDLSVAVFKAVSETARSVCFEHIAFVSTTDRWAELRFEDHGHWEVSLDHDPYGDLDRAGWHHLSENVIYSTKGKWAMSISREGHALLGGPGPFTNSVCRQLVDVGVECGAKAFLARWEYNRHRFGADVTWIPALLVGVYGEEQANQLLGKAGWKS